MSEAVLDAGPLIHLAELDALDALVDFSALFIPMDLHPKAIFLTMTLLPDLLQSIEGSRLTALLAY